MSSLEELPVTPLPTNYSTDRDLFAIPPAITAVHDAMEPDMAQKIFGVIAHERWSVSAFLIRKRDDTMFVLGDSRNGNEHLTWRYEEPGEWLEGQPYESWTNWTVPGVKDAVDAQDDYVCNLMVVPVLIEATILADLPQDFENTTAKAADLVFKGVGLALLQDESEPGFGGFMNVRIDSVHTMLRLIETEPAKSQWA